MAATLQIRWRSSRRPLPPSGNRKRRPRQVQPRQSRRPDLADRDRKRTRQRAGRDDLAGGERRVIRSSPSTREMPQRINGPSSTLAAAAVFHQFSAAEKLDLERLEPAQVLRCNGRAARPRGAVQAVGATVSAAANLQPGKSIARSRSRGRPRRCSRAVALTSIGPDRGRQAEHDFWLDARLGQVRQRTSPADLACSGAVVDVAPDRRMDLVFLPDRAIGEADLAADRPALPAPRASRTSAAAR